MSKNNARRVARAAALIAGACSLLFAALSLTATAPPPSSVSVTFNGRLSAQGSVVIPQPVTFSGQLSARGSVVVPQPVVFSGSLSARGSFLRPAVTAPNRQSPAPTRTQ